MSAADLIALAERDQATVERVCRAMIAASRPNADPDALTPCPHGTGGLMPKWRLFEHLAEASIAELRRAAPGVFYPQEALLPTEGSDAMSAAATECIGRNGPWLVVWSAMVAAALNARGGEA